MITVAQREKLEELIENYAEASAVYAESRGDGAMASAADGAADQISVFLDGITEVKK